MKKIEIKKISIMLADDHPVFRRGLVQVLQSDPRMDITAEASNGEEALLAIENFKPDIAIIDIDMPVLNGLEVLKEINKRKLAVKSIFLTMYEEERMVNKALDLGVCGYVLKESAVSDILNCVQIVASGKYYISPSISDCLVRRVQQKSLLENFNASLASLTISERRIISLISENKTTREIANELNISINTVENHRSNICRKLNITGNNALLRFALENKSQI
jgi:DNA-binding NarL/FixJ family response regulator